ncbi:hypothetical protein SRABI106_03771 [Rahnella aquatilis]|nr:hypothetical protein SRABI106_03771 [Rahnella aquatilis]
MRRTVQKAVHVAAGQQRSQRLQHIVQLLITRLVHSSQCHRFFCSAGQSQKCSVSVFGLFQAGFGIRHQLSDVFLGLFQRQTRCRAVKGITGLQQIRPGLAERITLFSGVGYLLKIQFIRVGGLQR